MKRWLIYSGYDELHDFCRIVETAKLEHFGCLKHKKVKVKGRYYDLNGQKHYNFMVLPRLGSSIRSNQSINQSKKKFTFWGLDNTGLVIYTCYGPFSLSFPQWCCQVQYVIYCKTLDPSLSKQITRCVGSKTACWLFLTKSWILKALFFQQPDSNHSLYFLLQPTNQTLTQLIPAFSCYIQRVPTWWIKLFPTSYPAFPLLSYPLLFTDNTHWNWIYMICS